MANLSNHSDGSVGRMADQLESFQAATKEFTTFLDLFPRNDSIAIRSVDTRRALTYKELVEFAESLDLGSFGVTIRGHGGTAEELDRLCVMIPNGPELAVCFIAMAQYCTYAPLNPELTEAELEFEVTDIPAKALVVQHSLDAKVINVATKQQVPLIELVPSDKIAGIFSLRWHASSPVNLPKQQRVRAKRNDIALVLHTSGTTKKPKIVPLTHENICVGASCIASTLKLETGDINMNMMPLYHIHGLAINVLASLLAGASLIATPGFSVDNVLGWLALDGAQPNWYSAVPTMHQLVAERAEETLSKGAMPHSLKLIRNCSAALLPWLSAKMEKLFELNVMPTYAMTESMPICSNPRDDRGEDPLTRKRRRLSSVGFAAGPEVKVLDDVGLPAGVDCEGEVCVRGACVTAGYEFRCHMGEGNDPNIEAFHRNPPTNGARLADEPDNRWLRTGDKGFIDKDGYLTLVGRFKEIINHSGEKFSPLAVEEVLQQYPACKRLLAFAMPHDTFGEVVGVAVVLNAGSELQLDDLRAYGLEHGLPPKSLPEIIIFMDAIPLGPTGKPARINLAGPEKCRYKMNPMTLSADQVVTWRAEGDKLVPINGPSLHSSTQQEFDLDNVREAVIDVIASQLRTRRTAFSAGTKIQEFGIDSVRVIQFTRALQEKFECDIPTKVIVGGTVSSISEAIMPLVAGRQKVKEAPRVSAASSVSVAVPVHISPAGSSLTVVDPSARIEKDVAIGNFCVIGKGVVIGQGTTVQSHCVIQDGAVVGAGSFIGAFCVIESNVTLGRETTLGTHCSLGGSGAIRIGANNKLESHCRITAIAPWETVIGDRNCLHSHVVLGFSPQDYNTRPKPAGGIIIGNNNVLREGVSIDAACGHDDGHYAVTKIGNNCYLMKNSHVAHDGLIEDNVTLTMNVQVAGYVRLMNNVNIGVGSVVHQFTTVGSYCMIGMGTAVTRDPLPFTTYMSRLGQSSEGSVLINRVGLQRAGRTEADIDELEHFYQHVYSPLSGPLKGQCDSSKWFSEIFQTYDQHRASQERKRPIGDYLA